MTNGESIPVAAEIVEVIDRPPTANQPANPLVMAHSLLRGRYRWAIMLAVVGAVLGALGGYFLVPATYRSQGVIRVKPVLPKYMYEVDEKSMMPRFDGFVESQVQFVKSQTVIDLAMGSKKWKELGRPLTNESIAQFAQSLQVTRPKNSELILVAFEDREPAVASTAVNAIMDAYLAKYGDTDTDNNARRIDELKGRRDNLDAQIASKTGAITTLAKEFGSDGEALKRTYDYKVDVLNRLESQVLEAELAVVLGEARSAVDEKAGNSLGADQDLMLLIDEVMFRLKRDRSAAVRETEILSSRFGELHPEMVRAKSKVSGIDEEIAERAEWLKQRGAAAPARGGILTTPAQSIEQLREALARVSQLHQRVRKETVELGRKNLQIEGFKAELEVLKSRLKEVDALLDALQFEGKNVAGRIEITSEADRPLAPYKDRRAALAALGSIGLAGLAIGCLMLVGLSDRRMHRIADASAEIRSGSKVLGIVPELQDSALDFGSATIAAHCVHQIRAGLQMRNASHSTFAITSPSAGDGKTTLAVALGMSFAASGTKTLLMDMDLIGGGLSARMASSAHRRLGQMLLRAGYLTDVQLSEALAAARRQRRRVGDVLVESGAITRDQLDKALLDQLQTSVGLSEVLAGESVADCVARCGLPNLYVLPLGTAGREQVSQLSPELIRRIVAEAQKHFATVLIDTGPILGSLEAAMVAGGGSGVILAMSRGGNKTLARRAAAALRDAGSRLEGIVFNRAEPGDLLTSGYSSYATRVSQSGTASRSRRRQIAQVVAKPSTSAPQ